MNAKRDHMKPARFSGASLACLVLFAVGCAPIGGSDPNSLDPALQSLLAADGGQPTVASPSDGATAREISAKSLDGAKQMNWTFSVAGATATELGSHSFRWDFGDGARSGGANVQHLYLTSGLYHVTVQASDSSGVASYSLSQITIAGTDTQALSQFAVVFNSEFAEGPSPSVRYSAGSTPLAPGETVSYTWTFSDGGAAAGPVVQRSAALPSGPSTVTLLGHTSAGRSSSFSQTFDDSGAVVIAGDPASSPAAGAGRIRAYWDYHGWATEEKWPEAEAANPSIEGVIISTRWNVCEPAQGVFDFSGLDAEVAWWAARGKKVILRNAVNGATQGGYVCPEWVYQQGIEKLVFQPKQSKPDLMPMPVSWDSELFLTYLDEFVAALAAHYDGDPRVSYVWIGVGNLGNTTVDPSRPGTEAVLAAGWTPDLWATYINAVIDRYAARFLQTPIYLSGSPIWVQSQSNQTIAGYMHDAAAYAISKGAFIQFKGMDPDPNLVNVMPLGSVTDAVAEASAAGTLPSGFTLFLGDDWPLWADAERRATDPQVDNRDNAGFASALLQCLQFWERAGSTADLVIVLQEPEVQAFTSGSTGYDDSVESILRSFLEGNSAELQANAGAWVTQP